MNTVNLIVQSADDPKNLLSSKEKAAELPLGLTVVYMEKATERGHLGVELIFKGPDAYGNNTIMVAGVTENNFEGIMGGFIGARMRFGRMPENEYEVVRHYVKQQVTRFIDTLDADDREMIEDKMKHFFGVGR